MYIDGWKYVKLDGQIQPDTWYHLVATFDGAEMKAYLNGAEAGTTAAAGSIKHNTAVHYMTIGTNVNASATERPSLSVKLRSRASTPTR